MSRLGTGIIALFMIINLPACTVGRKPTHKKVIVDSTAMARSNDSIKAVTLNNEKKLLITTLTPIWLKQIAFNTFNAKIKAHYEGPDDKQDFTANVRIEKDKVIWANITALGMVNVARIIITPDSFKLINFLEKKVKLMSLAEARNMLPVPVDFHIIQNMLLGNALQQSGEITDASQFGGSWSLRSEDEHYIQQYSYNKSDTTMRSAQLSSKKDAGTQGMIQLGNYVLVNARKFATSRAINMMSAGKTQYIDMNYNKVDFDEPVEFPFSIPKKYEVNGVVDNSDENEPRPGQQKRIQRREVRRSK